MQDALQRGEETWATTTGEKIGGVEMEVNER